MEIENRYMSCCGSQVLVIPKTFCDRFSIFWVSCAPLTSLIGDTLFDFRLSIRNNENR